jgi:phosphate uptake regulator
MERRKVQLTGGSTYTVSLPKGWAGDHGIEAGAQLFLYPHDDGSIEVRPNPSDDDPRTVHATVGDRSPAALETTIETLYAAGVDECTLVAADESGDGDRDGFGDGTNDGNGVGGGDGFDDSDGFDGGDNFDDSDGFDGGDGFDDSDGFHHGNSVDDGHGFDRDQRLAIENAVSRLLGFEIVEETADRFALQSLLRTADVSVRQSLDQLRLTTLSMHRSAVAGALDADPGRAEQVLERADEASRLFALVARYYNRALTDLREVDRLGMDRPVLADHVATARQLDRLARQSSRLAERVLDRQPESGIDAGNDLGSLADRGRAIVADATTAVLGHPDAEAAYAAVADREDVTRAVAALERTASFDDADGDPLLGLALLDDVRRTADVGGTIARIGIRGAARRDEL